MTPERLQKARSTLVLVLLVDEEEATAEDVTAATGLTLSGTDILGVGQHGVVAQSTQGHGDVLLHGLVQEWLDKHGISEDMGGAVVITWL